MRPSVFHNVFDPFPDAFFLKADGVWHQNPAARQLELSEADLNRLEQELDDGVFWLRGVRYRLTVSDAADVLLIQLQEAFRREDAITVSGKLRTDLSRAFGGIVDLSDSGAVPAGTPMGEALGDISNAFYRILRTVEELEYAASGPLVPAGSLAPMDLIPVLEELLDEVRPMCTQAGITLEAALTPATLGVNANREMLTYAILQLLSNSLKYTPSGGKISLQLQELRDMAVLTLTDTGPGLSPDALTLPLWDQPMRLEAGRGVGLGLTLVQQIVSAHGGTLVVSRPKKGARVTISLPTCHLPMRLSSPVRPPMDPTGGFSQAKIVLADALPGSLYYPEPED